MIRRTAILVVIVRGMSTHGNHWRRLIYAIAALYMEEYTPRRDALRRDTRGRGMLLARAMVGSFDFAVQESFNAVHCKGCACGLFLLLLFIVNDVMILLLTFEPDFSRFLSQNIIIRCPLGRISPEIF